MERAALLASTICYLSGFGLTLYALGAGRFRPGRFDMLAVGLGAAFQGWFLLLRGAREHACPIGGLQETLIFLSWSVALLYLVVGSAYRLSLMGAFTSPLVLVLQTAGLILPDGSRSGFLRPNPWVEAHAALSLIAYGAFGLACVSGLMYLVQEGQLKSRRPAPIFHHLPPISILSESTVRLMAAGLVLLTAGFAAGLLARGTVTGGKYWFSLGVWALYAAVLAASRSGALAGRRFAAAAAGSFALALLLLPVIEQLSSVRHG